MSKHTPDEIRDFAQKHAPALAEKISALCGDVITKGMVGLLEEVCRLQAQRDALLEALQKIASMDYGNQYARGCAEIARAAIAAATGAQAGEVAGRG